MASLAPPPVVGPNMAVPPPPRKNNSPVFADAPSQYLAFPKNEGITLSEIVAFVPNGLRSFAVTFRFASNGYSNQTLEDMVDYYRTPSSKGKVDKNTICKIMQKSVRDKKLFTYPGTKMVDGTRVAVTLEWTNNYHQQANLKDFFGPFDHTNLELTGKSPDLGKNGVLVKEVRFDSLAIGVRRFPSHQRGDGLNLSRCVQYAVAHPHENWMYPTHFTALIEHMGRHPIQQSHLDGEAFRRWKNGPPSPAAALIKVPLLAHGATAPAAQAAALPAVQPPLAMTIAPFAPVPSHFVAPISHPAARGGLDSAMSSRSTRSAALRAAPSGVSKSRKSQRKKMLWSDALTVQFQRMQNTIDLHAASVRAQVESDDQALPVLDPALSANSNSGHVQHPVLAYGNEQQVSYAYPELPSDQNSVPLLPYGSIQQDSYSTQYQQFPRPEPQYNQHCAPAVPQDYQHPVFGDTIMDGMDLDLWDPEVLNAARTPTKEELDQFFNNLENGVVTAPVVPNDAWPHYTGNGVAAVSMFPDLPPVIYGFEGQAQELPGTPSRQNLLYHEFDENGFVQPNGVGPSYSHPRHDSW